MMRMFERGRDTSKTMHRGAAVAALRDGKDLRRKNAKVSAMWRALARPSLHAVAWLCQLMWHATSDFLGSL